MVGRLPDFQSVDMNTASLQAHLVPFRVHGFQDPQFVTKHGQDQSSASNKGAYIGATTIHQKHIYILLQCFRFVFRWHPSPPNRKGPIWGPSYLWRGAKCHPSVDFTSCYGLISDCVAVSFLRMRGCAAQPGSSPPITTNKFKVLYK